MIRNTVVCVKTKVSIFMSNIVIKFLRSKLFGLLIFCVLKLMFSVQLVHILPFVLSSRRVYLVNTY